ncbi:MAG TPA: D-alanyl-D-alanine carboxypeptidase [Actinomycetes bacterium]|nr:D-alanyl-D-alanine carboxypeptidase [Actinomycetes bacterium]
MQPNEVHSFPPRRPRLVPAALFVLALATAPVLTATPAAAAPPAPRVTANTGVLLDVGTGAVLWQRSAHTPVRVASTTKIVTALVAEHVYPPRKVFLVPRAAENVDGTRFGYQAGMRVSRHNLLTTLLMVSANDAAETLAAAYRKRGRAGFLEAMNAQASSLGCTDSTFRDPSGLDAPGHRASAADLAILGRALLTRPELAKIVATRSTPYRWPDHHLQIISNHNHFVGYGRDPGAIGIKTGYTVAAHSTIVAAQRRGGRTLIAVALGTDHMYEDVRSMFAYGFATRPAANAPKLGRDAVARASSVGPTQVEPVTGGAGADAQSSDPILRRIKAAPVPALATVAIALLVLGVMVTAFTRAGRQ